MRISELWSVVLGFLTSLGGGAVIILGVSNWFGKVWAERFMQAEKQRHARELEEMRAYYSEAL